MPYVCDDEQIIDSELFYLSDFLERYLIGVLSNLNIRTLSFFKLYNLKHIYPITYFSS